jgi:hypothetical protein
MQLVARFAMVNIRQASKFHRSALGRELIMVILQRVLKLDADGRELDVPIRIYLPIDKGDHWQCDYEIAWPDAVRRRKIRGVDSLQAMFLALQTIGSELYHSDAHKSGKLKWEKPGGGYGFPLHRQIRDLLEGDDTSM